MRVLLFAAATALSLSACSRAPDLAVVAFGPAATDGYAGRNAAAVAKVAGIQNMPVEYAVMSLPAPNLAPGLLYGVMNWASYTYHRDHGSLGDFRAANAADLFAFQASYGKDVSGYKGICAPVSAHVNGQDEMAVLSDGDKLGLWQQSCKWALVVLPAGPTA